MLNSPVWRGSPSWAFALGLLAGGVASALALVVLGSVLRLLAPPLVWLTLAAAWFVVLAVRETGAISFALPQNARLVPESVFRHGPFFGPFQFGLEMGTGVRTYVTSGLPYALDVVVAFLATPLTAVAAGIGFGLGRSVMTFGNLRYDEDAGWDREFDRWGVLIRVLVFVSYAVSLGVVAHLFL